MNAKTDEKDVRDLLERWAAASRAKDIDGIFACYSSDILAFDAIGEMQFKGEAYRTHWEQCLSHMQGEMQFEIHELDIAADGDLAFCHYLGRCGGTGPDGKEHSMWVRVTACCRKLQGQWRVVHEHFSAPFDPVSGKALCDLEPKAEQASAA